MEQFAHEDLLQKKLKRGKISLEQYNSLMSGMNKGYIDVTESSIKDILPGAKKSFFD